MDGVSQNFGNLLPIIALTTRRRVGLIYIMEEVWNYASGVFLQQ